MHARSALFDLYGDHLRTRGDQAPVAAVVRLLAPVGIAAPAVRTAISRMVLQEWLEPVTLPSGRGYRATARAIQRLDEAAARIYHLGDRTWSGSWHLVLLDPIRSRAQRSRLRNELTWLGYAELGDGTWVSPWAPVELTDTLERAGASATTAVATDFDPPGRPVHAWDLSALGEEYSRWLDEVDGSLAALRSCDDEDEADFAARFHLVHEWRKFLFRDPWLPDELLPADWPGRAAAGRFAELAGSLEPGAARFVDRCLAGEATS
ncbi:PaaX family transcriptional regulator C-terminal domain-containing protein [Nocardioides sp.]|uniref:PaaX family transcriptional regulator n=1 Tax=Nocardioides sp. TaxID=35761 RepID=UPI002733BB30|nr:PaaX family transcriptional regulator C-terminal domain-containing protein [Nocardioides sp.]MDP3893527.1 PaaX family transcriptional regulator C-terminal domain-containing protein [Nocardioides sp.]